MPEFDEDVARESAGTEGLAEPSRPETEHPLAVGEEFPIVSDEEALPVEPVLSAVIFTYNHENYLRQALDSVLMQEVSFPFEIIVSEDKSTDSTREILQEYQNRYPEKIVLILSEVNLHNNEVVSRAIASAKGRYISFLDGDDYWVSTDKLQKQFDHMEAHPECAITFHDVARVTADGEIIRVISGPSGRSSIEDLIQGNFITSCSCVTRRSTIFPSPEWLRDLPSGDWPLHLLAARSGSIDHIEGLTAHYRIHGNASWSTTPVVEQWLRTLSMLMDLEDHLGEAYRAAFARSRKNIFDQIQTAIPEAIAAASSASSSEEPAGDPDERVRLAEWTSREAKVRAWEASVRIRELEALLQGAEASVADRHAVMARAEAAESERQALMEAIAAARGGEAAAEGRFRELEAKSEASRLEAEGRMREFEGRSEKWHSLFQLAELGRLEAERARRDWLEQSRLEAEQVRRDWADQVRHEVTQIRRDVSETRSAELAEIRAAAAAAEARLQADLVASDERRRRELKRLRMREKRTIVGFGVAIVVLLGWVFWMQFS